MAQLIGIDIEHNIEHTDIDPNVAPGVVLHVDYGRRNSMRTLEQFLAHLHSLSVQLWLEETNLRFLCTQRHNDCGTAQ